MEKKAPQLRILCHRIAKLPQIVPGFFYSTIIGNRIGQRLGKSFPNLVFNHSEQNFLKEFMGNPVYLDRLSF